MSKSLHSGKPLPVKFGVGYLKHVPLPTFRQVEPAPLCVRGVHVIHVTLHLLGKEFLCLVKHLLESQGEVEEEYPLTTNVLSMDHSTSLPGTRFQRLPHSDT